MRVVGDTVAVSGTGGVGMNAVQGAVRRRQPAAGIPMIASPRHDGTIKLTELITKQYTLDEINEGHQDLMDGKNISGVIVHQH